MLNGFRGITWGDGPNMLGENKILMWEAENQATYIKKDDPMSFYGIQTAQPVYTFSSKGLIHVNAQFYGIEKYEVFLTLFNKNGINLIDLSNDVRGETIGDTNLRYVKMHIVETKITGISLELYSDNTGNITVYSNGL
jgi:hypothetical protein